jgi:predicted DCC family thiol-disulfide oxidoreductase YuxK
MTAGNGKTSPELLRPRAWMLWDGECNFCRNAASWFLRHDKGGVLRPCPYQLAPRPPMTDEIYQACEFAVHIVTPEGAVLKAGQASLYLLETAGYAWLARILRRRPLVWAVELLYKIVAANRDFFARFFFTREDSRANVVQP